MTHRLGLATLTIIDADTLTFIDAAAAAEFDVVTLRLVPSRPGDPYMPLVGNPTLTREVRGRLGDSGLAVFDIEACRLVAETDVRAVRPALELAADLGARTLLAIAMDNDEGRMLTNLTALCDVAAQSGLSVGLEFMPYSEVKTIEDAERVVRQAGRSNLGIVVDALHLSRSGGSPASVRAVDPALITYVQICDAKARIPHTAEGLSNESRRDRKLPGQGTLWLDELMDALPADITVAVEAPCVEFAGLPAVERAKLAAAATRTFLAKRTAAR